MLRRAAFLRQFSRSLVLAVVIACPAVAAAVGTQMFTTQPASTGEKPQSKIWYHDGSYWAIVLGPDGVAFYEKVGNAWVRGTFANAVLASSGQADVKWNGTNLFVLNHASTVRLFKYTYAASTRTWQLVSGFPVTVPSPGDSETMVLEQDSTGRLWATTESGGSIRAYYSTSADHRTWNSTAVILRTGVNADDISSIVAFGGDKVGVFWSDQNRWEFGFRVHQDTDAPTTWSSTEIVVSGSGVSDDHVSLATDSQGRVYAITKDVNDQMRVHRRGATGGWTTKTNVLPGIGTRGIIQVAEADAKVYILYTRWGVSPYRIEYRVADIATLTFAGTTTFISTSSDMNNVTGMKQPLPAGSLVAIAENMSHCWYNSFGQPPAATPQPPSNVMASLLANPMRVALTWTPPAGAPDGYDVYRQQDGGAFSKLNTSLVTTTSFTDVAPPLAALCYHVRSVKGALTSAPSASACADNSLQPPPNPPVGLTVTLVEVPDVPALMHLKFDEGSGQTAMDASGNAHHARLGSATGSDNADPAWIQGKTGRALLFDGTNDYLQIADAPSLDLAGSFTVEAWVRYESGVGTIANKGQSGTRTYRIRINNGDLEFRWETSSGSAREVIASNAITDADWHHVACVYDQARSENRIYLDGVQAATGSASGAPAANNEPLHVGARLTSSLRDFLNGALDELRITPLALYEENFVPASRAAQVAGTGDHEVTSVRAELAWQPQTSGTPAVGYHVERSTNGGAFTRLDAATVTTTTWSDTSIEFGTSCYRVNAVSAQGFEGEWSDPVCVEFLPPLLAAPSAMDATLIVNSGGTPHGVAAFDFEQSGGQSFADATGNGHSLTLGRNASSDLTDPVWTAGIHGACLRFDGFDDRATALDAPDLSLTGSFTLEAWIALRDGSVPRCILAKGLEGSLNYTLSIDAAGRLELRWNDATGGVHGVVSEQPAISMSEGDWHHVAGVFDAAAGEARVYVDGLLAASAAAAAPTLTNNTPLHLGCVQVSGGTAKHFAGSIDQVRIAAQVLYAAPFTPPQTLDPPSVAHADLSWAAVEGAAGYNVYRQEGAMWSLLNATLLQATAFIDFAPPAGEACYRVAAVDSLGREGAASTPACVQSPTTDAITTAFPSALGVDAFPNPLVAGTRLALHLPVESRLRLDVFDVRGRLVARLLDAHRNAGEHAVAWDGRDARGQQLPAGAYFAVLEAGGQRAVRKLLMLR